MNFFTEENRELHQEEDQLRRQKSAMKVKLDSIDKEQQKGRVKKYDVYLDSCSCVDFAIRQKPCKHMYRLAQELGLFEFNVESMKSLKPTARDDEEARKNFKARITKLSEPAQKLLQQCVSLHERFFSVDELAKIKELEQASFVKMRPIEFLDIQNRYTIADILSKCTGEKPPKKNRREPVMKFFAENYPYEAALMVKAIYGDETIFVGLTEDTEKQIVVAQRYLAQLLGAVERELPRFMAYL